uniref:Uncharacterized protein n=1 Tax=Amphimedon queenslandica TaxID=400682 RepID=A0A1X7VY20_AMPQE
MRDGFMNHMNIAITSRERFKSARTISKETRCSKMMSHCQFSFINSHVLLSSCES